MLAPARQRGFTLLEIMVVVSLIALLSLVVVTQTTWVDDDHQLDDESARLKDAISLLNERSLFSGQLLALRLQDNGWTPLAYDLVKQQFVPVTITGLQARQLPPSLELVWQLDDLQDDDNPDPVSLKDVADTLVKKRRQNGMDTLQNPDDDGDDGAGQGSEDKEEDKPFPQVFFFPSGETSPVTLTLRSRDDIDAEQRIKLSALGHISDPDVPDDQQEKHSGRVTDEVQRQQSLEDAP
ncbi:general secretion pathway protein H [Alcanivorax hongdengensis A-11-3]|uniref:General secretion pathway protein H n=1 Tax=Alcanivorax hongdengensis A-11-3 TaxID=1177179 RepID=L0WBW8_9GAMM|nr:type II secretion system protein [Alcanivorax hongdengensis]EKF73592.1 general secretion pathway protein H [Alcanivorax hongdengensis A-11-3]